MTRFRGDVDSPFAGDSLLEALLELSIRSGVTDGDLFFFVDGLIGVVTTEMPKPSAPFKGVGGLPLPALKYLDLLFLEAGLDGSIDD